MSENMIYDIESAEDADIPAAFEGTPKESEQKKAEPYRIFKTQEEFQECIDRALGKRLLKARQVSQELEGTKKELDTLFERYKVSSITELSDVLCEKENVQTEIDASISAEAVENELQNLAQNQSAFYGTYQAESLLEDKRFAALIKNGFSVKEAFDALHIPELLKEQREADKAEIIREIRLRGLRPEESALSGYGSFSHSLDPKNLSDEQRAEIRERVRRGERITF